MENIFSTKERIKILKTVIYSNDVISVNSLADRLKLSKGLVSKYLDILVKESILKRLNGKFMVVNSAVTKSFKIMLNIKKIPINILKRYSFIKGAGIYGSCAKGENDEESDMDIWVIIDETSDQQLAEFAARFKKKVEQANLIFLTHKKIEKIKKEDPLFYHSLVFGSITIYGGDHDIQI